ncbi:DUF3618 domain-containing protein [Arthrobacter monumenti]
MSTNTTPHSPEPGKDANISDIQADIDTTRTELGQTVEQLSERLDVKAQAKRKADAYKARAADAADSTREQVLGVVTATGEKARELTHSGEADPGADRRLGGITLGSAGLLVCALITGVLVWRLRASAHKTSLPSGRDLAKQLRRARKTALAPSGRCGIARR